MFKFEFWKETKIIFKEKIKIRKKKEKKSMYTLSSLIK